MNGSRVDLSPCAEPSITDLGQRTGRQANARGGKPTHWAASQPSYGKAPTQPEKDEKARFDVKRSTLDVRRFNQPSRCPLN